MPGNAKNTVRTTNAEPRGFQDGAAELCYARSEGGLGHVRVHAGARPADSATLENVTRPGGIFMALGAPNTVAIQHAKPLRLKNRTPQLFHSGPELSFSSK